MSEHYSTVYRAAAVLNIWVRLQEIHFKSMRMAELGCQRTRADQYPDQGMPDTLGTSNISKDNYSMRLPM
jgi:hypothetical protein